MKSLTAGYASFDYEPTEAAPADVVKVDIHINGKAVDALAFIVHRSKAERQGRAIASKLKEQIDKHNFEIRITAVVGGRTIASERVTAYRKDVLRVNGKMMGGGDVTRKKKLLEKQKAGKARMKTVGEVQLSQEAFLSIVRKN